MTESEFLSTLEQVRRLLGHYAKKLARRPVFSQQDLMQAAVATLWESRAKMVGIDNPRGWMANAGRWAMLRHIRKHRRRHRLHGHVSIGEVEYTHLLAFDPAPEGLAEMLDLLPPVEADVMRRRFGRGEELRGIATAVGLSRSAVRRRIGSALKRLRGCRVA